MSNIIAKVYRTENSEIGSLVELSDETNKFTGRVAQISGNEFLVDWEDGARTIENKSDYELVMEAHNGEGISGHTHFVYDQLNSDGSKEKKFLTPEEKAALPKEPEEEYDPLEFAGSVTAAENPAQPAGWAVPPVDAEAYPDGELIQEQFDKRRDTAEWTDAQNRAPMDNENPAQPAGFAVPEASGEPILGQGADGLKMTANVYADDVTGEGGLVELENEDLKMIGKIITANDDEFLVQWQDSTRTVENKSDYNLILNNNIDLEASIEE